MNRMRCTGRTPAVAAVATVSAATLLLGATGAAAGRDPAAASVETTTVQTCAFPSQGLKVGVRLTLRDENDNDIKRIKVRVGSKAETGSFYRKGVTLRSIKISTHQIDGDAIAVSVYNRTTSPTYVNLDPKTSGAEVDKVVTLSRLRLADGGTATATCTVSLSD